MSSDKKTPDQDEIREVLAEKADAKHDVVTPGKKPSFGQQVIIAVLVVAVGVLFGMGPSLGLIQDGGRANPLPDISHSEAANFQRIANNMIAQISERQGAMSLQGAAQQLKFAKIAEEEGLLPRKAVLDQLFNDWLDEMVSETSTRRAIIKDNMDGRFGVSPAEARHFYAVNTAASVHAARYLPQPAIPLADARLARKTAVDRMFGQSNPVGDRITMARVTLNASTLSATHAATIADDEVRLQNRYDDLRDEFYRIQPAVELVLFVADGSGLSSRVSIDDADVKAAYEADKETRYVLEDDTESASTTAPAFRPYAEVAPQIRGELEREAGTAIANRLMDRFMDKLIKARISNNVDNDIEQLASIAAETVITKEDDPRLNENAVVEVVRGLKVRRPAVGNVLDLGAYGRMDDVKVKLFQGDMDIGSLTPPYSHPESDGLYLMSMVTGKEAASYRPFEEVKDEIIAYEASRAAYTDLLAAAEDLAEQANAAGGLQALFADPTLKATWGIADVSTRSNSIEERFAAPATEVDGQVGETQPLIAIAGVDRPVTVIATGSGRGDTLSSRSPTLDLVQVTGYEMGPGPRDPATLQDTVNGQFVGLLNQEYQQDLIQAIQSGG